MTAIQIANTTNWIVVVPRIGMNEPIGGLGGATNQVTVVWAEGGEEMGILDGHVPRTWMVNAGKKT